MANVYDRRNQAMQCSSDQQAAQLWRQYQAALLICRTASRSEGWAAISHLDRAERLHLSETRSNSAPWMALELQQVMQQRHAG